MGIFVRMEKESEPLVLLLDGVDMGKGFNLKYAIPVSVGGIGARVEDLEGGDHGLEALEFGTEAVGSLRIFESRFEVRVLELGLCKRLQTLGYWLSLSCLHHLLLLLLATVGEGESNRGRSVGFYRGFPDYFSVRTKKK